MERMDNIRSAAGGLLDAHANLGTSIWGDNVVGRTITAPQRAMSKVVTPDGAQFSGKLHDDKFVKRHHD